MNTFENVYFHGQFREYQQRVLDNSKRFLADNKINIVAAPGSGKTILGLELIRRLNNPCLILSPTVTIRQQWGERFESSFLESNDDINNYFSYDLKFPALINSITYQALYSAIKKIPVTTDYEKVDYSGIDLFNLIKTCRIKTICLDEAHHLQNEWQKALKIFIDSIDKDITVISLTATPPYDANANEWNRYISVCGEIDDEIYVPELVKNNSLCPHQDFIYFNYPDKDEISDLKNRKSNIFEALNEICALPFIAELNDCVMRLFLTNPDFIYAHYDSFVAIFLLLNFSGAKINFSVFKKLTGKKKIPDMSIVAAETALTFLLSEDSIIKDNEKQMITDILKKYGALDKNRVNLQLTEKQKRRLLSSAGKLDSIVKIVKAEYESLKSGLRMLILTDFIKKEQLAFAGKNTVHKDISIVSIFDVLQSYSSVRLGVLSGSLVILPNDIRDYLINYSILGIDDIKMEAIPYTDYSVCYFKYGNKNKIKVVSGLLENGKINVLIGTQALLGEGWDSPCINSLILASYVGSFMLSNQMRGRAIRINPEDSKKTANIWHLVTVEPQYIFEDDKLKSLIMKIDDDKNEISSFDFQTLCRRFECFVGPDYETGQIESGIERVSFLQPPFTKDKYDEINQKMLEKAELREKTAEDWKNGTADSAQIEHVNEIPIACKVPSFAYYNILGVILASMICNITVQIIDNVFSNLLINSNSLFLMILYVASLVLFIVLTPYFTYFIIKHGSPKSSIKCLCTAVLQTFQQIGLIRKNAGLTVRGDNIGVNIIVSLSDASIREQSNFNRAVKEMLSPITNPKYVIIQKNIFGVRNYKLSFACPSELAKNEQSIRQFTANLKKQLGLLDLVYCYSEKGRKIMLKCQRKSFISRNNRLIYGRQSVKKQK